MKLYFPKFLAVTPCSAVLNAEGLSEGGAPVSSVNWSGSVIYSNKSKTVLTADSKQVRLEGSIQIEGDVAPSLPVIADGTATVGDKTYSIFRALRPRNPDGTVHHTTLELM